MKNTQYVLVGLLALIIIVGAVVLLGAKRPSTTSTPVSTSTPSVSTQRTYMDPLLHFSIAYPEDFSANTSYSYGALGPTKEIQGVSFTIPSSMAKGTNLSSDTYLSVESLATSSCSAQSFIGDSISTSTQVVSENGVTYDFTKGSGAGAGNFYEEYVYAIHGTKPCLAIRYFIHSTNIGNYPPGTVREYDKSALLSAFDSIRRSLKLNP